MKPTWNVTKLTAAASLGVLLLVLSLLGASIAGITGIPGTSGIINLFVSGIMFVLCCLVIRAFGAATIMSFVYSAVAIPLPLYGTPGFVPKVFIGIAIGLIADVVYLLLRGNERLASLAIGAATQLSVGWAIIILGRSFGMPGVEQFAQMALSPIGVLSGIILGGIAGYLGWLVYSRIKNTTVVIRIQGG